MAELLKQLLLFVTQRRKRTPQYARIVVVVVIIRLSQCGVEAGFGCAGRGFGGGMLNGFEFVEEVLCERGLERGEGESGWRS